MIERLKKYLNIRSLEDAVIDFSSILEKETALKLELDLLANDFQSVSKSFEDQLKDEKDIETVEFIKSKSESFTSNYLSQLVEKKKEFDKIQSKKKSLLDLYPQLEKAVVDWKREQFIYRTLDLYRSGKMELDDCDMIIKASTKEKVKYSDNLVFNEKGELLIVQRGPLDENGPNLWVLPGGHVDVDEKHIDAAKRELLEETGYEVKDCYNVGSFTDDKVYIEYYSSMVDTSEQSPTVDADESRYTEFVPIKDLYKYPTMYNMWDRVYEILGIDEKVVKMKKSIVDGLVSGEKIEKLIDKSINIGGEIEKKEFDKIMKASKDGFLTALGQSKSILHSPSIDIPLDESNDKELLRLSIAAELDAINLYEKMAEKAQSSKIKKVLLDVAKEEKTHIGEFEALLKDIDKEHKGELEEGAKEVDEIEKAKKLGHLIPKKVQIKGRDGKVYNAIRWVNPETGESEKYSDKLKEKKAIEGITFEDSIEKIMNSDLPKSDKVRNLVNLGVYDSSVLTLLTGEPTPSYFLKESDIDIKDLPDNSAAVKDIIHKQQQDNDTPQERQTNTLLRDISIEELWDNYERNLRRVARGRHKFAVAYGSGGVGKSYIFRQIAKQLELREYDDEIQPSKDQYDFVVISGKITPTQVYAEMYRHRDKLIVFDDCDSFLQTEEVQGFLKAGLDTGEQTKISNKSSKKVYNIEGDPESGTIPNTFSFKGRVIAITNLIARQLDQAVKSRALCVNLTMTVDETIDKLGSIKDKIEILTADKSEVIDVSQKARDFAFEVLKKNKDKLGGDINTRVYSNAVLIASDGMDDQVSEDKIEREIVSYFDSVTGSFDEMIRKIKGK